LAGTDNGKYVDRGRGLVAACDPGRGDDLRDANRRRNGAPFLHAGGLIMAAAALRTALRVPYRQLSGMPESMLDGRASPSYPVPCRRMRLLDVDVRGGTAAVRDPDRRPVMVADATGLKQHNRGERVRQTRIRRPGDGRGDLRASGQQSPVRPGQEGGGVPGTAPPRCAPGKA